MFLCVCAHTHTQTHTHRHTHRQTHRHTHTHTHTHIHTSRGLSIIQQTAATRWVERMDSVDTL